MWEDDRLNALDKIILMEIDSLDNNNAGCFASNEYLARFCQCSERKVTEAVSKLLECQYIRCGEYDGRHRKLHSRLAENASQSSKNCESDPQNLRPINISNNIKENKEKDIQEKESRKSSQFLQPTLEEVAEYIREKGYHVDPEKWYYHYESNGWRVGKNAMKNWHAAIVTWERRYLQENPTLSSGIHRKMGDPK